MLVDYHGQVSRRLSTTGLKALSSFQVILKAHHGLNISEFCWMLETIAKKRLEMLGDAAQDDSDPCKTKSHIVFDLTQVLQCFHEILRCPPEILDVVQVHRDIISDILCELDSLV